MLFEQVRADYLVTEPADYSIQLMVAMSQTELPKIGKNLIVVGLVGQGLVIRIFDAKRTMVLDRTEDRLLAEKLSPSSGSDSNSEWMKSFLTGNGRRKSGWRTCQPTRGTTCSWMN